MAKLKNLDKRIKSIVIASYLGDGTISKPATPNDNCYLKISHSIKQKEYIEYKANLFGDLANQPYIVNRLFKDKPYTCITFETHRNKFFRQLRQHYRDGRKYLKKWMLNYLDLEGVAIWYMDDGSLKRAKRKYKDGTIKTVCEGCKFAICSLSEKEYNLLIKYFNNKYNLFPKVYLTHGKYPVLVFNKTESDKLFSLISPYIPEFMRYKIDLQREVPK